MSSHSSIESRQRSVVISARLDIRPIPFATKIPQIVMFLCLCLTLLVPVAEAQKSAASTSQTNYQKGIAALQRGDLATARAAFELSLIHISEPTRLLSISY